MKASVLFLSISLFLILSGLNFQETVICNSKLLQYYGLKGIPTSTLYAPLLSKMAEDYCPYLENSCCSASDFDLSYKLWVANVDRLKIYLSQIYKVIEKFSLMQSSLIQFLPKIKEKDTPICKEINAYLFNSPVKFDEMRNYIINAIEAYAYIQKGFYCLLCDPVAHQFLKMDPDNGATSVQFSQKSCDDLIFFFREFIAYKIYFIEPLLQDLNKVMNCVHDTDQNNFQHDLQVPYNAVSNCLVNGNGCWKVCKDFRLGQPSYLFIGSLKEYKLIITSIEGIIGKLNKVEMAYEDLQILEENISSEHFVLSDDTSFLSTVGLLTNQNLSCSQSKFQKTGIDIYHTAVNSNYFLGQDFSVDDVKVHYERVKLNPFDVDTFDQQIRVRPDLISQENTEDTLTQIVSGSTLVESSHLVNNALETFAIGASFHSAIVQPKQETIVIGSQQGSINSVTSNQNSKATLLGANSYVTKSNAAEIPPENLPNVKDLERAYFGKMANNEHQELNPENQVKGKESEKTNRTWWQSFLNLFTSSPSMSK